MLKIPSHQRSRRAHYGRITAIYGGRPAKGEGQSMIGRGRIIRIMPILIFADPIPPDSVLHLSYSQINYINIISAKYGFGVF